MSYFENRRVAEEKSGYPLSENCSCCGKELGGPMIRYDMHGGDVPTLWMHRDCAFAMAQRIICDAWPNRRAGASMKNDK